MKYILALLTLTLMASMAHAYDVSMVITHENYTWTAGYRVKYGNTKGGPYPTVIECGKPTRDADNNIPCAGTNITAYPMYAVPVAYDAQNAETEPGPEYMFIPKLGAPSILRIGAKTVAPVATKSVVK
jgi:hypothetical protein